MGTEITCTRFTCKHYKHGDKCTNPSSICISIDGCDSYEKGFAHYTNKVWNALRNGNMIMHLDITEDVKIGAYYICKIFNVIFSTYHRADWVWHGFSYQKEDGSYSEPLTKNKICEREINEEALMVCYNNFNEGILPNGENEELFLTPSEKEDIELTKLKQEAVKSFKNNKQRFSEAQTKDNTLDNDYGFITPMGDFISGDWGYHEETAFKILLANNWEDEFVKWDGENGNSRLARDFLIDQKNYCLIHSPAQNGIIVTYNKLTKHQRNYLFDYFAQRNDYSMAFLYGVEEEN